MAIKCMKNHFDSLDQVGSDGPTGYAALRLAGEKLGTSSCGASPPPQVNNLREIQALRRLSPHPGVIKLAEVLYDQPTGRLALVFELMDMNIYELIRGRRQYLPEPKVKAYMYQLLKSMDHMHRNGIFHRDIKVRDAETRALMIARAPIRVSLQLPCEEHEAEYADSCKSSCAHAPKSHAKHTPSLCLQPENILITDDELKLADFGSCRGIYSKQPYTEYISTRWYRAPECLLTDGFYNYKMDLWGVGCVFFEVMSLYPLFPGTNELDQVAKIHNILGTPPPATLDKLKKHSNSHIDFNFPSKEGTPMAKLLPHCSAECVDIITKLLAYDPDDRISARQAVKHPYFRELRAVEKQNQPAGTGHRGDKVLESMSATHKSRRVAEGHTNAGHSGHATGSDSSLPTILRGGAVGVHGGALHQISPVRRVDQHGGFGSDTETNVGLHNSMNSSNKSGHDSNHATSMLPSIHPNTGNDASAQERSSLPPICGASTHGAGCSSNVVGSFAGLKIDSKSLMLSPTKNHGVKTQKRTGGGTKKPGAARSTLGFGSSALARSVERLGQDSIDLSFSSSGQNSSVAHHDHPAHSLQAGGPLFELDGVSISKPLAKSKQPYMSPYSQSALQKSKKASVAPI
eukprot:scaffold258429_cov31-Tisochrysis_lutea.AAC.2